MTSEGSTPDELMRVYGRHAAIICRTVLQTVLEKLDGRVRAVLTEFMKIVMTVTETYARRPDC